MRNGGFSPEVTDLEVYKTGWLTRSSEDDIALLSLLQPRSPIALIALRLLNGPSASAFNNPTNTRNENENVFVPNVGVQCDVLCLLKKSEDRLMEIERPLVTIMVFAREE